MTVNAYLMQLIAPALVGGLGLFALRKQSPSRRELLLCLWFGYCLSLGMQILAPIAGWQPLDWLRRGMTAVNLTPFATLKLFYRAGGTAAKINLLGNVLVFVPLGLVPPLLWNKFRRPITGILPGFCFSLAVECLQYFTGRSVDIDDLILNTLGAAVGWLLWRIFKKHGAE